MLSIPYKYHASECQKGKRLWHTVEILEPSVIYEGKDGKYGEDGSETY